MNNEKIKEKEKKISELNIEIKRRDDKIKFYTDEVKNLKDLIEKNKISYNELYSSLQFFLYILHLSFLNQLAMYLYLAGE